MNEKKNDWDRNEKRQQLWRGWRGTEQSELLVCLLVERKNKIRAGKAVGELSFERL